MRKQPAVVILGASGLASAQRIAKQCVGARIHGLRGRVSETDVDVSFDDAGATLRELYLSDTPIIALCAAGIVIRCLAPLLSAKATEPPVLAVAVDGSAVVPLLGGLSGVNELAREIGVALEVKPAITTSGELRFGTCLLNPPEGFVLSDVELGKTFVADLLAGHSVRIEGEAPWLASTPLPLDASASHTIHITTQARAARADELLIHPRTLVAAVDATLPIEAEAVLAALAAWQVAKASLACLLVPTQLPTRAQWADVAAQLRVPLRTFVVTGTDLSAKTLAAQAAPAPMEPLRTLPGIALIARASMPAALAVGSGRGQLTVVGLGPGAAQLRVPAASAALEAAEDVLGYATYVEMAGPFRPDQVLHCTDNREELQRARHALALAASGRRVVVVSSGDPGVFAMAAAVLEALEASPDPTWHAVALQIYPGVSAALATAALAGAPLGHDFCVLSLSDNLKPWEVIEARLEHALQADLALAWYNPISKARPWQLGRALEIVRAHRAPQTVVVLGRDVGRPAQQLTVLSLAQLTPAQVDMRTLVIIGASTTRRFNREGGGEWVYTPRWYGESGQLKSAEKP